MAFEKNFKNSLCVLCALYHVQLRVHTSSLISGPLGRCFCSALSNSPMSPSLHIPPSGELQDLSFLCFVELYGTSNHVPS